MNKGAADVYENYGIVQAMDEYYIYKIIITDDEHPIHELSYEKTAI